MQKFGYEYNADGLVSRHTDSVNGKTYNYTYDLLGRLQKTEISDGSSIGYTFDKVNNVTNTSYKFGGVTKSTTYNHFKSGVVCDVTYPNGATKTRKLNAHAQVRPSYLTTPAGKTWSINRQYYTPTIGGTTYTTNVMGNLIYENIDRTFSYAYNGSGNISKITDKTGTVSKDSTFVYDEANQLIRENNAYTNKTVTYTYDAGGNILTKTEYPFTTSSLDGLTGTVVNYTYGNTNWKDLLTEFNGNAITYDQIGNPLSYYNGTTFTWYRGRKLETATTADGKNISYFYDDSGIRTQKIIDGVKTDYFLDGSTIIAEKTGNNTTWYYYDGDGTREAIEYKGNTYYYFYNAQGDVMGLYDNNLNVVVEYAYDSWGNVVSITGSMADTLGQDNPFRYRGYYFDSDTGLYYLNSRYYDSNTGRFINADGEVSGASTIQGYNLFVYCFNNPVNLSDETGHWPEWIEKAANWVKNKIENNVVKPIKNAINNALYVKYDVPLYNQGDAPLCWAYSQVMVESYHTGNTLTQTEADNRAREIAVSVYGEDNWRQAGWPTNTGKKISSVNRFSLRAELKNGPLYGYYANSDSGHLIVITGVDVRNGIVYTNNPWGISGQQSIKDFKKGFVGQSDDQDMPLICIYGVN